MKSEIAAAGTGRARVKVGQPPAAGERSERLDACEPGQNSAETRVSAALAGVLDARGRAELANSSHLLKRLARRATHAALVVRLLVKDLLPALGVIIELGHEGAPCGS